MYGETKVIIMILCSLYFGFSNSKFCERSGVLECCLGYNWNKIENRCIPCGKGYIGQNCSDPCPPQYYGRECTSRCNCTNNQYCDHVHGCTQPQEIALQSSPTSNFVDQLNNEIHERHTCQKPMLKPEEHMHTTSLMWAVIVCLFLISVTFFTTYMYLKLREKPNVAVSETL